MPLDRTEDKIARKAGRGFIFILAAKLYFLIAGYAIVVTLSWVLGRALYGVYGLVVGAISVLDNVIVTGTIQAVSKFTAEDEERTGAVKAAALKLQLVLGGGVAATFALIAPGIAAFERDPSLTPYLRLASGIVLCYAFYAVFVGSANGLKRFGTQAGLDALYATIRGVLIVGLAAAGFAVWGAVSGFVIASFVILIVSLVVVGVGDLKVGFPSKRLVLFALPVMAYLLVVNISMFADLFLLKRIAGEALGVSAESANELTGAYVAVQQLARITYQALLAVTFVVFPLVSRSTFEKDQEATKSYIATTMRYSLIMSAGIAVVFMALPGPVLAVPFAPEYQIGASSLATLAPGYVAFSLFIVATTILNAAGKPLTAFIVTAIMMAAEVSLCWVLLPHSDTPGGLLVTAALCATGGMGLGWLLASIALWRSFKAWTPFATLLRVGAACAGAISIGQLWLPQGSRLLTLAECGVVVVVYGVILLATRELGRADLDRILNVIRRKPQA